MDKKDLNRVKICITGAHSTGKTTLIESYIQKYNLQLYYVIKEKARELINRGIPMGKEASVESYLIYINEQLSSEITADNSLFQVLLADRSIIDGLAHPLVNQAFNFHTYPNYFLDMYEKILVFQKNFYDLYVYLPIEFHMISDGVRPNDEKYRFAIDEMILYLLNKHKVNFQILNGSIDQRLLNLHKLLKALLLSNSPSTEQV